MQPTRRTFLLGAAAVAARAANAETKRQDEMAEGRNAFTSAGQAITVETFTATAGERRPAVIVLHGADGLSSNTQYRLGAEAVAAAGYNVYLVHYLDRTRERHASLATVFQNFYPWLETVGDALAWVASRPEVDPERIGLVGISLGAALGLALAGKDRRVKALVDYFGPLPQGAVDRNARLPPTLILHGAADPVVPLANALAVEALVKDQGSPYEIRIYPDQGHGFRGAAQDDAIERVIAFLHRYLNAGGGAAAAPLSITGPGR